MDNNGTNNNKEHSPDRSLNALERKARPVLERMLIERFPSAFREMPDSFIHAVLEDVYTDSAWQTEGRFNDDDVSLALQSELMICVHEIHGREQAVPVRQPDTEESEKKSGDVQLFDSLDIMKMYAIVLGKIQGGEYAGKYISSFRYHENTWFKYTDVTISEDYFETLSAFAQHIQKQTDKTRIEIIAPFFDGINLEPIDKFGCKPLSEDDMLVGKVVVIRADVLRPEYQHSTYQLRLCEGGFGAHPRSRGSACFCKSLLTGEEGRFERDEFLGTIERDNLPMWAKQKLDAIQQQEKKKNRESEAR